MRISFKIRPEGVKHGHHARGKSLPFAPFQKCPARRREQIPVTAPIPTEEVPQFRRYGEDEVMIRDVHELGASPLDPFIHHHLAAGGAEPGLTGVGDDSFHKAASFADVLVVS